MWQYRSGISQENHQLQLIITAQKGVSIDFDAAGRDAKTQSKELYLWGQTQDDGIKGESIMLDLDNCSGADWLCIGRVDVTDRLAYLNYVQGALSYTLATEIDKCAPTQDLFEVVYNIGTDHFHRSRSVWKHVRDAEAGLVPRRTIRQNFRNEIAKIQNAGGRTGNLDAKLQQLEAQLKKAEADDAPLEKELDLLRRAAIKESEAIKWKAFRDVSEECS